jgi:hypothetical protein
MLTRFEDELNIFDIFVVDKTLPKYRVEENEANVNLSSSGFVTVGGVSSINEQWGGIDGSNVPDETNQTMFRKFLNLFKRTPKPKISIEQFFKHIKNNAEELGVIDKRLAGYQEILKNAQDAGQTALVETIKDNIEVVRHETQLLAKGLKTVITEDQVIEFYKESEKGIRLDWVKNFSRIIPSEIINTKKMLDELCVFDNYVVMHYDPNMKSYKMTKAEKEKRKDPILFGVIKGSRKLYFVGDWIDEVCDLTLDTLVSKFGEDAIKQNDISVNISLQKDKPTNVIIK